MTGRGLKLGWEPGSHPGSTVLTTLRFPKRRNQDYCRNRIRTPHECIRPSLHHQSQALLALALDGEKSGSCGLDFSDNLGYFFELLPVEVQGHQYVLHKSCKVRIRIVGWRRNQARCQKCRGIRNCCRSRTGGPHAHEDSHFCCSDRFLLLIPPYILNWLRKWDSGNCGCPFANHPSIAERGRNSGANCNSAA